jgi:dGTPase
MLERLRLAPDSSVRRRYPEPAHPYRNDFQRDRDRVVHSRAFRRLEGKTQVFTAGYDDHFRNRLTHTIEVSQVARTVAHTLGLNEDYTDCLALAHDLGHPPFGHSGERELDRKMKHFGGRFEHNAHSLRIVDVLEIRYARFPGLNLTTEVREGILKHSRDIAPEETEYADLLPGLKPPLEAQLLDAADEIAYTTADLDDAFGAGLIKPDEIADTVPVFKTIAEQVDTSYPGVTPRIRFWEIQRQIMNLLIGGLIEGTVRTVEELRVGDIQDLRHCPVRVAKLRPEALQINRQLKGLLASHVYENENLKRMRSVAITKIGWMFDLLISRPEAIPAAYRELLENEPPHRVVCDYMAGMTDSYFERRFDDLMEDC